MADLSHTLAVSGFHLSVLLGISLSCMLSLRLLLLPVHCSQLSAAATVGPIFTTCQQFRVSIATVVVLEGSGSVGGMSALANIFQLLDPVDTA